MINFLKSEIRSYGLSFLPEHPDAELRENLMLKLAHTFRVYRLAARLCGAEHFAPRETELTLVAALLHDYSRFEQFSRYRSFNDAASFDHGLRSAELAKIRLLPELRNHYDAAELADILDAVRGHNQLWIPEGFSPRAVRLCRVVRDADKLDIMRIILRYLRHPGNGQITFNLNSSATLTPAVAAALTAGEIPRHADMRTALDFVAAKFSWFADLNFPFSRTEWKRCDFSGALAAELPDSPELRAIRRRFGA